ncbi:aldehyde dehydrogenase family protein [Rothia aerolata]|uniref:Aldehyde dehydrogenase n=1 Tax=Rothia aerolata TaxID=1812262 RepID=A0A917IM11_9MICC|nr:aldehyde dehydrogenase family protein [Rothia aerolata]GGH58452.1 aldehyde dehydrogenase [Rothia aerolata]
MSQLEKAVHWINGQWVDSGETKESHDPATGEVIGTYVEAGPDEMQQAIDAAQKAFKETDWKDNRRLRNIVLTKLAEAFEQAMPELVEITGLENGKVKSHAEIEFEVVPHTFRVNAGLTLTDFGRAMQVIPGSLDMVLREPVGVAGIIAPWNSPVALGVRSLAPALAAGTTVVMHLPRQTAHINHLIAKTIASVKEIPEGVINVVIGGAKTGQLLVDSPAVPTISFTGSSQTGRSISASGADNLKRFGLELGGKTPMVVFDDADIDAYVATQVPALSVFAGQFCMTASRVLVHESVADEVRTKLVDALSQIKVGPAADPSSEMGPLIDRPNVERVNGMVEDAINDGAKVLLRGGPFTEGPLSEGAFYAPTLLEVDSCDFDIVQQEVFGPVLVMQTFTSEEEAIEMANATEYGLAAAIWSRDIDRPLRVAREIEAGTVWINDWAALFDQFEEGGYKASGVGRMRGLAVLDDFLECKHISLGPGRVGDHG